MKKMKKIFLLSSGGDSPGMNAAIRAVVRTALNEDIEIFGVDGGYQGLIDQKIHQMTAKSVANLIQKGGTALYTARCAGFLDKTTRDRCREFLKQEKVDGLIVLGGDGSFRGAQLLSEEGGPAVVGIPCTIDNDILGTEYTIGFDTACNTALQAIDKIRDTAFSLNRNFIVEVMGRSAGFLAVAVGIAGGAEFILIPEAPVSMPKLIQKIQNPKREKMASIIVVAEADEAGRSFNIAKEIEQLSNKIYKVCILGYIQRGGTPTVKDRVTASLMGYEAVQMLLRGESQKMTAVIADKIVSVPFPHINDGVRKFTQKDLLHINDVICDV